MRKVLSATALATVLSLGLLAPSIAAAQSVEDTINALKPKPGKSRGSRPVVTPPSGDLASTSAAPAAAPAPVVHQPAVAATTTYQAPPTARPSAPVAPAPVAVAPAAAEADAPSIDFNVLFASGSADLAPSAMKTLDVIGKALSSQELAGSRFRIEGHTDTVGTRDGNRSLSGRRAAAVVEYLRGKYGIDRSRLESAGKGQDALVVPTGDQVDEPRNRRVRIVNITG